MELPFPGPKFHDGCWMSNAQNRLEPRWPALLALLAVAGLRLALPGYLVIGPDWLLLVVVSALIVPTVTSRQRGYHRLNQVLGYLLTSIVTADMVWSLCLLLAALPSRKETPRALLVSAGALWVTNILVFALWYWRLDAGGPRARELRGVHTSGAFLFPQLTVSPAVRQNAGIFGEPFPIDAVENFVGQLADLRMFEMLAAGQDAAKQQRGIDRRKFRLPEPLAGADIGPVIEESVLVGQSLP